MAGQFLTVNSKDGGSAIIASPTRDDILNAIGRALRPLPFWIGYKRAKYWGHDLPEAAMVAELRETLIAALPPKHRVRCEVAYRLLRGTSGSPAKKPGRPCQADLAILDSEGKYVAIIEVKRGAEFGVEARKDLVKLKTLTGSATGARMFLIVLTEHGRPDKLVTTRGHARRSVAELGPGVRVRRSYHCNSSARERKRKGEHFALLLEVTNPPH